MKGIVYVRVDLGIISKKKFGPSSLVEFQDCALVRLALWGVVSGVGGIGMIKSSSVRRQESLQTHKNALSTGTGFN